MLREYVTGYVHGKQSSSDKPIGVVALTLFDLKLRKRINRILLAGTNGTKFGDIRDHLEKGLSIYKGMAPLARQFESFPADDIGRDPVAYKTALKQMRPGDIVIIFTPDHTHSEIVQDALNLEMHVYCAKPLVQKLEQHLDAIKILNNSQRRLLTGKKNFLLYFINIFRS